VYCTHITRVVGHKDETGWSDMDEDECRRIQRLPSMLYNYPHVEIRSTKTCSRKSRLATLIYTLLKPLN
jgi:hypothetical protein